MRSDRLCVERLDSRCLPSAGWPGVSSFTLVAPNACGPHEDRSLTAPLRTIPPAPVPTPVSDVTSGIGLAPLPPVGVDLELPPWHGIDCPAGEDGLTNEVRIGPNQPELPLPDRLGGLPGRVESALRLLLPHRVFNGLLLAVPEDVAVNRRPNVDWGDGVVTAAVFTPTAGGWLGVWAGRTLAGSATYNVKVILTTADDPSDRLEIRLQVVTPSEAPNDGPVNLNAVGYGAPVPVEVRPSEWLWVSLPVYVNPDWGRPEPLGGDLTPPPPPPQRPEDESALPPAPPGDAPSTTPKPPTPRSEDVPVLIGPPVVHPASHSPFEAGAVRATLEGPPPAMPWIIGAAGPVALPPDARTGGPDQSSPTVEKPAEVVTPYSAVVLPRAGPPAPWDWVLAVRVGPVEPAVPLPSRRANRSGTPEAILAGFVHAPSPDAVFATGPPTAVPAEDRRERWGWRSGAAALAAAAWAGVRFLWPRVGPSVRPAETTSVVADGAAPARDSADRPAAQSPAPRPARAAAGRLGSFADS